MPFHPALHASFLQAIHDEPEDILHRLAFADSCEEMGTDAGDARAKYIRLELRPPQHLSAQAVAEEKARLLKKYTEAWMEMDGFDEVEKRLLSNAEFNGFFTFTRCINFQSSGQEECQALIRLLQCYPVKQLYLGKDVLSKLLEHLAHAPLCPSLEWFSNDWLTNAHDEKTRSNLLSFLRQQENIKILDTIAHWTLSDFKALSQLPLAKNLKELSLWNNFFGDEALEILSKTERFPALKTVSLINNSFTSHGFASWLNSPVAKKLTNLCVESENNVGLLRTIADAEFPDLKQLQIYQGTNDDGVTALATSRGFPKLETLELLDDGVEQEVNFGSLAHLIASPHFPHLSTLQVDNCWGENNYASLININLPRTLTHAAHIKNFILRGINDGLSAVHAYGLASCPLLSSVENLDLSHNNLGHDGVAQLLHNQRLPNLKRLSVEYDTITDEEAKRLLHNPRIGRLDYVSVANEHVSASTLEQFPNRATQTSRA